MFFQPDEYDIRDKHPAAFFIRKHFISDDGTTEDDILNLNHGGLQVMLFTVLFYLIFSPVLPMIFLLVKYFEKGSNKTVLSLIMLAVCAAFCFLGGLYADHAHGLDGMRALAAVWGGFAGSVLSVILLILSFFI